MVGNVDNDTLETLGTAAEKQGSLDQQGGLVVEQGLPPPGRDEFRQDDGGHFFTKTISSVL
jgi:hypothetical protein